MGIECRLGILVAARAVGSHHTGTFPAGCGCLATLEKQIRFSQERGWQAVSRRQVTMQKARAVGIGFGEPLQVSPTSTFCLSLSHLVCCWKPGAVVKLSCCPYVCWNFPTSSQVAIPSLGASNQLRQLLWKTVWWFLKKLHKPPCDPATPLLGIYAPKN